MGYVIALAGKGGTGKTTIAALLVRIIKEKKLGSILAVDADPNSNLCESLGLESKETIGSILDDITAHPEKIPSGMPKDRFIEYQVQTTIIEGNGFDVLTMGRPEGPGCYCYVNNILRNILGKLINDYQYIIVDNEAGLEHFSRRTTKSADALVVISSPTYAGLRAAERISGLAKELGIKTKKNLLIVNCCDKEIERERIKSLDLDYLGLLPLDKHIEQAGISGNSLLELKENSPSLIALRKIGDKIWQCN
ncbi:MAG: AAA family ATPase [Candidatus Omnitrophota bacterium]